MKESGNRFVLFPIKYHQIWQAYKYVPVISSRWSRLTVGVALRKAEASFWTAEEMDLSKDMHDWENKLNDNERVCLLHLSALDYPDWSV